MGCFWHLCTHEPILCRLKSDTHKAWKVPLKKNEAFSQLNLRMVVHKQSRKWAVYQSIALFECSVPCGAPDDQLSLSTMHAYCGFVHLLPGLVLTYCSSAFHFGVQQSTWISVCITVVDGQSGPVLTFQSISACSTYTLGQLQELMPAHCRPP